MLVISLVIGWVTIIALGLIKGKLFGTATLVAGGTWLVVSAMIFLWKLNKEEST